jgi:hypothetical protein
VAIYWSRVGAAQIAMQNSIVTDDRRCEIRDLGAFLTRFASASSRAYPASSEIDEFVGSCARGRRRFFTSNVTR